MGWWPGGSGSCVACCSCELYCRAPRRAAVEHYPPHTADQACQTRQLVGSRAHGSDPLCRRSRPLWGGGMAPPHARAAGPDLSHLSAPPVPPDAPAADIAPAHRPSVANSTRVHWRRRAGSPRRTARCVAVSWAPGSPAAVPIDSSAQQHTLSSTPGTEQTTPAVSSTTGTTCSIVQLHNTLCCGRRSVNCTAAPSPDRNACMVPLAPHLCCNLLAASYVWLEHSSSLLLPRQAGSDGSERRPTILGSSPNRGVECRH